MNLVANVLGAAERASLPDTFAENPIIEQVFDAEFRLWLRRRLLFFMTVADLFGRGSGSERAVGRCLCASAAD